MNRTLTVQAFAAGVAASHSRSPFCDLNCGGSLDIRRGQSTDVSDREFFAEAARRCLSQKFKPDLVVKV